MTQKRIFDILVSILGLLFSLPILIVIAIIIKIRLPDGPVFYKQKRVGQYGKLFTMIKFRTMSINHHGNTISIKGDNRITPLGSVLRKYKLDELPELWNVLVGDMSIVGPRPDVPGYADKLEGDDRIILKLKPGITGPASLKYVNEEELLASQPDPIKYNNDVIWPDKIRINKRYFMSRNFWVDIKIIFYTLFGMNFSDDFK